VRFTRLAVFLFALIATPATDMEFAGRLKAFDDAYQRFVYTLCGWQPGVAPEVNAKGEAMCLLAKGHTDYATYAKARRAAMKLFDLAEKTK
jgi:hypothetical protein